MNKLTGFFKWITASKLRIGVAAFIVLGLGFFGYQKLNPANTQPEYQTAQVEKGNLVSSVTASGTVSQGGSVNITTNASGVVSQLYVKDGDSVKQGDKIADITLDLSSQQKQAAAWSSYLSAKNNLASAQNTLNSLNSAMWKAQQTFIKDAVTNSLSTDDPVYIQENSSWIEAENQYKNQQQVIIASQASVNSSWLSYAQLSPTITAPATGTISGLTLTPGFPITQSNSSTSTVSSSLGTIILEQGTPQANVNLTEIDVVKVHPGQKVTLTLDALPDKTFTGNVVAVNTNGSVSSGVTAYPTTIAFDTAVNTIYPNMAVNATIITDVKNDVLLVPSAAVQTANGESTVRVLKNNQPVVTTVQIGDSNDTQTEVISGLNEGDTVITGQTTTTTSSSQTTSVFGGGNRGFGGLGGGGGTAVRRN